MRDQALKDYVAIYEDVYANFCEQVGTHYLPFHKSIEKETQETWDAVQAKGVKVQNEGASLYYNHISSACKACKTGVGSMTSYISLKCHRKCYYCFNPNQQEYTCHTLEKKDWYGELTRIVASGQKLTHIALTGGEPLLHKEEVIAFFAYVQQHFKDAHTRLYTSGDLLEVSLLEKLQQLGLQEIRFSIKLEDTAEKIQVVLEKMALAKRYIPDIMVEMPVIPGTEVEMQELLLKLDEMGIYGINLLEFCYPYTNEVAFKAKGHTVKYPPYGTLYDFWYAGGLPIAESELLCLKLLDFAATQKLSIGVHYCSIDNKHFGQVYQQNTCIPCDERTFYFSEKDYYFKTIKIFGDDGVKARELFAKHPEVYYEANTQYGYVQCHPDALSYLSGEALAIGISYYIMEVRNNKPYARELKVVPTTLSALAKGQL
ncbi:MAG: radical SAM protein [Cellulosilyticaceae bacterium]